MPATVIRCQELTKYYGKTRGVEDLSFEVRPGQVFGVPEVLFAVIAVWRFMNRDVSA